MVTLSIALTVMPSRTRAPMSTLWVRVPLMLVALGILGHGLMWLVADQPWLLDRAANERLLETSYEKLLSADANAHLGRYLTGLYRFFGWWLVSLGSMTLAFVAAADFSRICVRRAAWLALAVALAGLYVLQWRFIPTSPFVWTSHAMTLALAWSIAAGSAARARGRGEYWEHNARHYDRAVKLLNGRMADVAAQVACDASNGETMLEVAAGTGLTTSVVAPVVGSYTATDKSQAMLDALRERTSALPNVRVQQADVVQLPFADGSFDRVLIGNLLHLLPDPSLALAEARRVLAPGGILIAPTFCHGASWRARIVSRLLGLTGLRTQRRFAGSDLDELVAAAGFTVKHAVWFRGRLPIRYVSAAKQG